MRLFAAVWPDRDTRARLSRLALPSVPGLRVVRPDEWHVTLRFLGEVDEQLVPRLVGALATAAETVAGPVMAVLGPATAWLGGGRVLELPVAGLEGLAGAVRTATLPLVPDRGRSEAPYVGHLTLARSPRRGPDGAAPPSLAGIPCSSTFRVDAIHLVGSRRTPGGPRYPTLGSARLPGGDGGASGRW